jgi:NTP pyrophosphatase (non-canonical NTP hydrolase)
MAILTEEVGEVARIIARSYGEQSPGASQVKPDDLADELSDVLFVVICLANQTGIDLDKAFKKNLKKKTARDFERHQQNDKLNDPRSHI